MSGEEQGGQSARNGGERYEKEFGENDGIGNGGSSSAHRVRRARGNGWNDESGSAGGSLSLIHI